MTEFKHPYWHIFFSRWLDTSIYGFTEYHTFRCDKCKQTFIKKWDRELNTVEVYIDD